MATFSRRVCNETACKYLYYDAEFEEELPQFAIQIAPTYLSSVGQGVYDIPASIRELDTRENELLILNYVQPLPLLIGIGYGGWENRLWRNFQSMPDLYYPPSGRAATSATVAAGGSATLIGPVVAPPSKQYATPIIRRVVAVNVGTSAGALTLADGATPLMTIPLAAGAYADFKDLSIRVWQTLSATATGSNFSVTVEYEWPQAPDIAVGFGVKVYMRVINPTPVTYNNVALVLTGKRYIVRQVGEGAEPKGLILPIP